MKQLVVIVIIAHKSQLSEPEKASLRQCYKILGNHPIRLVCPEGLDISVYREINPDAEVIFIDPKWQANYRMFNELKMSSFFYKMFRQFEFILFYELDAWVFRDELEYWCNKGYDYIGAPWVEGHGKPETTTLTGVGNGGFSLRKTESAINIIRRVKTLARWRKFWYKSKLQTMLRFESKIFEKVFKIHFNTNTINLFGQWQLQEDYYWAKYIASTFTRYKVAPIDDALKFSFEIYPSNLFRMNSKHLPFGCHAWESQEPEFWRKFIKI